MARCDFRPEARADLREIGKFIARRNRPRAISFVTELRQTCRRLADNPLMGQARAELGPGLRSFPHGDYLVFYHPTKDGVSIARVLHGSRLAGPLL